MCVHCIVLSDYGCHMTRYLKLLQSWLPCCKDCTSNWELKLIFFSIGCLKGYFVAVAGKEMKKMAAFLQLSSRCPMHSTTPFRIRFLGVYSVYESLPLHTLNGSRRWSSFVSSNTASSVGSSHSFLQIHSWYIKSLWQHFSLIISSLLQTLYWLLSKFPNPLSSLV